MHLVEIDTSYDFIYCSMQSIVSSALYIFPRFRDITAFVLWHFFYIPLLYILEVDRKRKFYFRPTPKPKPKASKSRRASVAQRGRAANIFHPYSTLWAV